MENNIFLEQINDTRNRKFPLHYTHVKTKIFENEDNYPISINDYQTKEYYSFLFHKPISKML